MEIVQTTDELAAQYAAEIPELIYATGPTGYNYMFPNRDVFDALVLASWGTPNTPFSSDSTRLAIADGELLGLEQGFVGPELWTRQAALTPTWQSLVEAGHLTGDELNEMVERAGYARWLNPILWSKAYYLHALSVKPEHRGKQIGAMLLRDSVERARDLGLREYQTDCYSIQPAIHFYRAMGMELLVESRAPIPEKHGVPTEYRMGMSLRR